MVRPVTRIFVLQALTALQPAASLVLGADTDRVVLVDASNTRGRFKNLQGTNTANTGESLGTDNIHNKDPVLAGLWPEYGIELVMIYSWPEVFLGFGATGDAADALDNSKYNWTEQNTPDVQDDCATLFPVLAAIAHGVAHGVANASDKAGVGAWGGNRIWTSHEIYTLYSPFVSRFYQDCKEQNVPLKAATFHFSNAQFSFDHELLSNNKKIIIKC